MKYFYFIFLFFFNTVCLNAADSELFYYQHSALEEKQLAGPGVYQIEINTECFEMPIGSELNLNIIGHPNYTVIHDNKVIHKNGDISWFGYLKEFSKNFRVNLIKGKDIIRGHIQIPYGEYRIKSFNKAIILESIHENSVIKGPSNQEDFLIPTLPVLEKRVKKKTAVFSDNGSKITIDIMILYNQEMMDVYPGTQLETRLNELVSIANQANIDSNVNIGFRIVHTDFINISNAISNSDALSMLTDGLGAFSSVAALRSKYGADLVTLLRPYDFSSHGGCGIAWLNGIGGNDISLYSDTGYNVVSDGWDGNFYCDDYTMAHEIAHNMGSVHDRNHTSSVGAYPYSYGYNIAGPFAFGTIMSYDSPTLGYFSNPDINECNGQPCGVPINNYGAANNALSLNNTRTQVAAFMDEVENGISQDQVNITSMDMGSIAGPSINTPVTVTVTANNPGNQDLYYKFYYKAGYGTAFYDSNPWVVLQDYSTNNTLNLTYAMADSYILVARVVLNPLEEPIVLPIIGQVVTVGDSNSVYIRSLTHNKSTTVTTNDRVTFSVNASTETGEPIYYKFFYRAKYGTPDYESSPWTVIQEYSTSNNCQYTFPSADDYIVVARAVIDPLNEPEVLPITGTVIHVD